MTTLEHMASGLRIENYCSDIGLVRGCVAINVPNSIRFARVTLCDGRNTLVVFGPKSLKILRSNYFPRT